MAPKSQLVEGIVVVMDVGPGTRLGLPIEETFFSKANTCLINILQRKLYAEKCRDKVGVVLFGTDGTYNALAANDQYQNITVLQEPRPVDWGSLDAAAALPRGGRSGDWLDALVVALDLLHDPRAVQQYSSKKVVLVTDFSGEFSDAQADAIITGIRKLGVDLSVIGPELSEDGSGDEVGGGSNGCGSQVGAGGLNWTGKPKTKVQLAGEALVTNIVAEVDGIVCSFKEAIPQLIFYQKKSVSSGNWNVLLDIGPDLQIPVTGRIKVKRAMIDTWSRCTVADEAATVIKESSFHLQDDAQTLVDEEDVIDGYRYGTTLVPFSAEDSQMSYSSGAEAAQLSVLGFSRTLHASLHLRAGDQVLVLSARDGDEAAGAAVSALVQALAELDMVGVTRRVYRRGLNPVMGALYPLIDGDQESLVWVGLPYQEDVRCLSFPSLRKYTDAVTSEQATSMDALIDALSLGGGDDGEEDAEELLEPSSVLNPHLQHYYNCCTDRVQHPGRPLPAPHPHVMALLSVPEELREEVEGVAAQLCKVFPVEKVVRRTKRERDNTLDVKGDTNVSKRSREDGDASSDDEASVPLCLGGRVTRVSTATPLQDFTAMLRRRPQDFSHVFEQVGEVVLQLLETVTSDSAAVLVAATTEKILDCLKGFRDESLIISPSIYNTFIPRLRQMLSGRGLTDSFMPSLSERNLGLITAAETLKSDVTAAQAEEFLKLEDEGDDLTTAAVEQPRQEEEDFEDLLDNL